MTYIMPEIGLATSDDIEGILNLQEQNLLGQGGLLSVRLPRPALEAALVDLPQIVARRDGRIVGVSADGIARPPRTSPDRTGDVSRLSWHLDAHENEPTCTESSGPTECAEMIRCDMR